MENRFFKTVFFIMLLCLVLCFVQLIRLEFGYELLNLFEERNLIALNPRQVVKQYIKALENKDYRIAYFYLSPDSKEKFSFAGFVSENEKLMTNLEEDKTWIEWQEVSVGIQIEEDPGTWGFVLHKINGKWKIIVKGGIPSFPFSKENEGYCIVDK